MKATLEFNLPEETEEFQVASNGWKWKMIVQEFDETLLKHLKYRSSPDWDDETVESIRQCLHEAIQEESLTLQ
jgi:hypothetical protein